jgi:hypothetical protein
MLLRQVEVLQLRCDHQAATTCARDAEIEELLLVLQGEGEQVNPEEEAEKENDNSTLDDNSEKG